jgi:aldose 1-epimerase
MARVEVAGEGLAETVTLRDARRGTAATLALGYGWNCFSFTLLHRGATTEFLYAEPGFPRADLKGTRSGIPLLAPFPNRIRGGKYSWAGKDYQLPATDGMGNAIHGFAWDSPWRLIDTSTTGEAASAAAEFQLSRDQPEKLALWPGDFRLRVEYRLHGKTLSHYGSVENVGSAPLPFGFGTHPYFRVPLSAKSTLADCSVQLAATESVELIGCLPTGATHQVAPPRDLRAGRSLDGHPLDDVYAGLRPSKDGRHVSVVADRRAAGRLTQTWDADFPYAVVYMPPHGQAVCVEPYTCVTDAINLKAIGDRATGLWTLAPGEQRSWRIDLEIEML